MERLKKFKEKDHKKLGIIIFTIGCIVLIGSVIFYKTFASFEVNHNFNIINGTVQEMGDLEFAFYVDDGIVREAPSESEKEKYVFDEENSSCTNGAKVYWDYEVWGPTVSNISGTKTKCYIKFKKEYSEPILNGAIPEIKGDLTPVTIDENGTVRKADIKSKWYSYESQKWANAVITKNSYELLGSNVHGEAKLEDGYVHLDGEDDYIDLGLDGYNFSEGLTLVLNAKLYDKTGAYFGNWEAGGGGISVEKTGDIWLKEHINGVYKNVKISHDEFDFENYHVIIGTYNNEKLQLIIDGEVKDTLDVQGTIKPSSLGIILGGNPSKNGLPPDAISQMDVKQAAIFNRAITEEEFRGLSTDNFKITNDEGLLKYVDFTNKEYESNEVIPEESIESYFVWIPRYRYQLWNGEEETNKFKNILEDLETIVNATQDQRLNQQQPIRIEFESKGMPVSNSSEKGEYLTHPAFTSFESNGFWVGKFETGYKGAIDTSKAQVDEKDPSKVVVKPNVYSWRNINLVNSFDNSKEYKPNLDSHMMKNTEWGAVAYLTNSKYGRCKNNQCEKVRINNSESCVTGSSAVNEPIIGYDGYADYESNKPEEDTINVINYNNKASNLSSTTNNYYGVYDIVGGVWERVMGVMNDQNGNSSINQVGFTNVPEEKYYDVYEYSSVEQDFDRGLFGDGTKEIGPFYKGTYNNKKIQLGSWFAGEATFVSENFPWFERGGSNVDGSNASIFSFLKAGDGLHERIGFRIVLTP